MSFPNGFLDELRTRTGLADTVGRRVKLQRRGREFVGLCPFHKEKTPSFTVNEDKGFYHCFGCGKHGDIISFAMETENLSFPEAVERLAGDAGMEVPRATPEEAKREKRRAGLHELVEAATVWFQAQLAGEAGGAARAYFEHRGLDDRTIQQFRLGYAPAQPRGSESQIESTLRKQGFEQAMLVEAGLMTVPDDGRAAFDFFRDRVMFPIADARGRVVAFGGRVLGNGEPKYLNSRDTPLFDKRRTLYNLAAARSALKETPDLIVAEGYMDVIALARGGFPAAVAPLGTAFTEEQMRLLWRLVDEPILCFDGDTAGQRAAERAADRALPQLKPGKSLRFAFLPEGEDPDSLITAQGGDALKRLIEVARPLAEVIWNMEVSAGPTDTPERFAGLKARLRDRSGRIDDPSVREQYRELFDRRTASRRNRSDGRSGQIGRNRGFQPARETRARTNLAAAKAGLDRSTQRWLMAALINHPTLIDEFADEIAAVELDENLDEFRTILHDVFVANPDLDAEQLHRHLSDSGFADILSLVLDPGVLRNARFACGDSPLEDAREGVSGILAGFRRRRQQAEFRDYAREAAREGTEESEARFRQRGEDVLESIELDTSADL